MIKQIGIVLVILIIVLWGFGKLMDSAMADVTGAGTTTNDQVNSSGSNTAITGGYHSEATTNYQAGSHLVILQAQLLLTTQLMLIKVTQE